MQQPLRRLLCTGWRLETANLLLGEPQLSSSRNTSPRLSRPTRRAIAPPSCQLRTACPSALEARALGKRSRAFESSSQATLEVLLLLVIVFTDATAQTAICSQKVKCALGRPAVERNLGKI